MYPLRFEPLFRRYLWGGRRLASALNKPIGEAPCAESWEIVDHGEDQSVVVAGSWKGRPLGDLVRTEGVALLGPKVARQIASPTVPSQLRHRFPLLLKFLDADRDLSVQVHPDDAIAATLDRPDLGKTEAWYVMQADPGARIYAGLKSGVDLEGLRRAIAEGVTESVLHSFEPSAGDCIFIRAGTVHAIGAGLLVAEIQQASDTTFRMFDWNRLDRDGQPRPLHIEQALAATDFMLGPVKAVDRVSGGAGESELLVSCEQFVLRHWRMNSATRFGGDDRFRILAVLSGELSVENDPCEIPLRAGETMLIPACCSALEWTPRRSCEFLEIYSGEKAGD